MVTVKVVTTQLVTVWSNVPPRGEDIGDILAGQSLKIQYDNEDLNVKYALIVWPPNLYPDYLGKGHKGYIEIAHTHPEGDPVAGGATLDGIMALLAKMDAKIDKLVAEK